MAGKRKRSGGTFQVQARLCATCIYRPDSTLNLAALEDAVRDPYVGFKGYRECHHAQRGSGVCCRGFWEAHRDEFAAGQIAQRLDLVEMVDVDVLQTKRKSERRPGSRDHLHKNKQAKPDRNKVQARDRVADCGEKERNQREEQQQE